MFYLHCQFSHIRATFVRAGNTRIVALIDEVLVILSVQIYRAYVENDTVYL